MGDYGRETTFSHNIPNRNEQKKSVPGAGGGWVARVHARERDEMGPTRENQNYKEKACCSARPSFLL